MVTPQDWWMPTLPIFPLRQTMDIPRCAAAISPFDALRCARLHPSLLLDRGRRSYHCCMPQRIGHCRNSPCDHRPEKSNSLLSATTQTPVHSPVKCCPRLTVRHASGVHVLALFHPGSPSAELVSRHSVRPPHVLMRHRGQIHRSMPSPPVLRSSIFRVSEHFTDRRGLDP